MREAARLVAEAARASVRRRGVFRVVLAGGSTPKALYFLLAGRDYRDLPWADTEFFWGDERYLPHDHSESNFRMADNILLSRVPVSPDRVHPIPTGSDDPVRDGEATRRNLNAAVALRGLCSGPSEPVY